MTDTTAASVDSVSEVIENAADEPLDTPPTSVPDTSSEADFAALLEDMNELNADDVEPDLPELEGEAEASVNALMDGIIASTDLSLFQDMMHLVESAGLYDACLEWLQGHLHAHRVRINAYHDSPHKTTAEFEDIVRTTEELERLSHMLKKIRRDLGWAKNRFRRKYQCGH